jgi:signal peptidase II
MMLRFILIMVLVAVSDQLTKFWILQQFNLHDSLTVVPGFFNLTLLYNSGAAFGILSGMPLLWRQVFFIGISSIALIALIVMQYKLGPRHFLYAISFGLISGGALGNMIDRVRWGAVVDFLDFYIGQYHWPAFNVADSGISVGIFLFLLLQFWEERQKPDQNCQA